MIRMFNWWSDTLQSSTNTGIMIFVKMGDALEPDDKGELAGYVFLEKPFSETGPFRASVQKLLVSPKYRRRGIARILMAKLEEVAREEGRTLIVSSEAFREGQY